MENLLIKRPAAERGHVKIDWLNSYHTFSFGHYRDANWMGFSALRVINDDTVAPAAGFDTHPHENMEIITYVTEGAVKHKDTLGTEQTISAGEVQLMRAGTGIAHSEYNASNTDDAKFLQIWIHPRVDGLPPAYQQRVFTAEEKTGQWRAIVTPTKQDDSLHIEQDVTLLTRFINTSETVEVPIASDRSAWLHVVCGTVELNGETLTDSDSIGIVRGGHLTLKATETAEVLLFDLPPVELN